MYTQISDRAVSAVTKDVKTKMNVFNRLRERFGLKTNEMPRIYFQKRHDLLTTFDAVTIISEETGLAREEILAHLETIG
jgi:hypothetical protein